MRIAYIDHSFHRMTRSADFFREFLENSGETHLYWDDSWSGGTSILFDDICSRNYDLTVIFQSESAAAEIMRRRPSCRVVFVPMWDSSGSFVQEFWTRDLAGVGVVCFSAHQAEQLARWGVEVLSVRYWPEPPPAAPKLREDRIRGVFWWRREEWSLERIFTHCDLQRMASLHVHLGPDPGHRLDENQLCAAPLPLTVSRWGDDAGDYRRAMKEADVVFAPRLGEGIGTTILEAMAAGKAVIAADRPTMNEYIVDNVSGYLLPEGFTSSVELDTARQIGRRAREEAVRGRQQWVERQEQLLDWMLRGPNSKIKAIASANSSIDSRRVAAETKESAPALLVGHYAETIDDFVAERRTLLPVSWPKWSGHLAALLPRVPPPQAVTGPGAPGMDVEPSAYAELLRSRDIRHLDEISVILPPANLRERYRRLRFQADVLRAWGFPAVDVRAALEEKMRDFAKEDYEFAVARGQLWSCPRHWPEWWRRTWPVWRKHGARGGFKLLLARLKKAGPNPRLPVVS